MPVNKPQLGGQGEITQVQRTQISSPRVASNNSLADISKSIGSIISSIGSVQAKKKEEQTKEDIALYKQKAQEDALHIANAIETGNSPIKEYNTYVAEQRNLGVTDTEINRGLYNLAYQTASEQIGEEVLEADKAYLQTMSLSSTKTDGIYAKKDLANITEDKKDLIYSTANITTPDENYQDVYNNNVSIAKQYGLSDDEVTALTIQRAFDLADRGDESMLEALQGMSHKGIKLIDTVTGSQMYAKLSDQHEDKLFQDGQRAEADKKKQQEATTQSLYSALVTGTPNYPKMKTNIDNSLLKGEISKSQHVSLSKFIKSTSTVKTYAKHSDAEIYSELRGKAQLGTLPIDELLIYKTKLSESHFKSIADLAISQGGTEGKGNVIGDALEVRMKEDGRAIGNISILDDPEASLFNKGKAREKASYATFQLKKKVNYFSSINGRHPSDEEYDRLLKIVRDDTDKKYSASEFDEPADTNVIPKQTLPVKQLRAEYSSLKTKEERRAYYLKLTPKQRELLKGR